MAVNPVGSLNQQDSEVFLAIASREISYIALALFSIFLLRKSRNGLMLLLLALTFIVICTTKMVYSGQSMANLIYGIRIVVLFLTIPAIWNLCAWGNIKWITILATIVKLVTVLLIPVTLYQVYFFPGQFGSTFFGARANGIFGNPILYSMVLASFALFLFSARDKRALTWTIILTALAILTGGRAGILACIMTILGIIVPRFVKSDRSIKLVMPLVGALFFIIISNPIITGREGTSSGFKDGRIEKWSEILDISTSAGIGNILLGTGLGDGTNASFRSGENESFNSDSTFVMMFRSFGLIGLIGFLGTIYIAYRKVNTDGFFVIVALVIFCMAQSLPEIHPVGLVITISLLLTVKRKSNVYNNIKPLPNISQFLEQPTSPYATTPSPAPRHIFRQPQRRWPH